MNVSTSIDDAVSFSQNSANQPRKTFLQLLTMDHIVGMAGAMRSRMMAERLAMKTADGTLGQPGSPVDEALRDMNVSVGDTIVIKMPEQPPVQPTTEASHTTPSTPPSQPAMPPTSATNGTAPQTSSFWRYVAAALTGAGLVAAGAGIPSVMRDDTPPAAVAPIDTDTDTQYEIGAVRLSSEDRAE